MMMTRVLSLLVLSLNVNSTISAGWPVTWLDVGPPLSTLCHCVLLLCLVWSRSP